VLFELGLIYGLGKTAFIIKAKEEDVPVDLRGIEYIEYDDFEQLEDTLIQYFRVYLSREGEIA
jgi:predicted nucleotide-binding protein